MNRLFLYSGFLFILILIFDAYDRDYNQPEIEISQSVISVSLYNSLYLSGTYKGLCGFYSDQNTNNGSLKSCSSNKSINLSLY